jgi:hypothetical protein
MPVPISFETQELMPFSNKAVKRYVVRRRYARRQRPEARGQGEEFGADRAV